MQKKLFCSENEVAVESNLEVESDEEEDEATIGTTSTGTTSDDGRIIRI